MAISVRGRLASSLVLFFAVGCSKKTEAPPASPPPTPAPVADAAQPAPPPPPPRVDPTPALRALFPAGTPQVPLAYRTLMPGVSRTTAQAKHAALLGAAQPLAGTTEGNGAVIFDLGTDKVRYLRFELPPEAEKVLAKAWGTGRVAKRNGRRAATFWFTDTAQFMLVQQGLRLRLEVWPYTPVKTLLGVTKRDVGGLVGASIKVVRERFVSAQWKGEGDTLSFALPGQRFYTRPVVVHLTVVKGKVKRADFRVAFGAYPEQDAEIDALLAPWGEAHQPAKMTRFFKRGRIGMELRRTRGARAIYQVGILQMKKGKASAKKKAP